MEPGTGDDRSADDLGPELTPEVEAKLREKANAARARLMPIEPDPERVIVPRRRSCALCRTPIATGDYCGPCGEKARRELTALALAPARESVSPGGANDAWRFGSDVYRGATRRIRELAQARCRQALPLLERGEWGRRSTLLLGETGIGKSRVLFALGLKLLDEAAASGDPAQVRQAAGIRWTSAHELARASRRHRMGDGEPPEIREALKATVLLLDEVGFEQAPKEIEYVLRRRHDAPALRTIVASGARLPELQQRYGVGTVRVMVDRGLLVDLWPAEPREAVPDRRVAAAGGAG